jgi:hypothetical protein
MNDAISGGSPVGLAPGTGTFCFINTMVVMTAKMIKIQPAHAAIKFRSSIQAVQPLWDSLSNSQQEKESSTA